MEIFRCILDGSNLTREGDVHHADKAAWLDELDEVAQVAIVGAVVEERIDGDYRIEEVFCEGQTMCVHPQGKDVRLAPECDRALAILARGRVAVCGPSLDTEFARKKN